MPHAASILTYLASGPLGIWYRAAGDDTPAHGGKCRFLAGTVADMGGRGAKAQPTALAQRPTPCPRRVRVTLAGGPFPATANMVCCSITRFSRGNIRGVQRILLDGGVMTERCLKWCLVVGVGLAVCAGSGILEPRREAQSLEKVPRPTETEWGPAPKEFAPGAPEPRLDGQGLDRPEIWGPSFPIPQGFTNSKPSWERRQPPAPLQNPWRPAEPDLHQRVLDQLRLCRPSHPTPTPHVTV